MISIHKIKETSSFKSITNEISQEDYYRMNGSNEDILTLVKMNNKSFGEKMQRIILEVLKLETPLNTGHDAKLGDIKFEVKSSRFWKGNKNRFWKWQHIMEEHDYDHLLFCGIDFNDIKLFAISKQELFKMKGSILKKQGGGEGQGFWVKYSDIKKHLIEISSDEELLKYIKNEN